MSMIDITDLTFGYDGSPDNVFEHVSVRLDTDWRLGFVGRNGRGKTTFLRLLLGQYQYSGKISASVAFEYFPYEIADPSALAIDAAREVWDGFAQWELERELSRLGADDSILWQPYETLSMGERTKVLLTVMFLRPGSFLLIDEPTNHLDAAARERTAAYLASKRGFILVSHDRAFLDACTDHTLSMNRAGIEVTAGNFSVWYENKCMADDYERAQNDRLKKEIGRLSATAREKAGWSERVESSKIGSGTYDRGYVGHKSAKLMARAKAIEKRVDAKIEEKSALLKNIEEYEDLALHPLEPHAKRLLSLDHMSLAYGEREVVRDLTMEICSGARVCLDGANGSGKSSVIRLILGGEELRVSGRFTKASGLKISYVPQDVSRLSGSLSDFERAAGVDVVLFRAILRKLDFSREMFELPLEAYSAGQKKKAALARSLAESAHLYIWDEPLNYIDIYSRIQLERLIRSSACTLLFVEHDRAFVDAAATEIIHL